MRHDDNNDDEEEEDDAHRYALRDSLRHGMPEGMLPHDNTHPVQKHGDAGALLCSRVKDGRRRAREYFTTHIQSIKYFTHGDPGALFCE